MQKNVSLQQNLAKGQCWMDGWSSYCKSWHLLSVSSTLLYLL